MVSPTSGNGVSDRASTIVIHHALLCSEHPSAPVLPPAQVSKLLLEGNERRKTEATEANTCSSRSHAVLQLVVSGTDRNHYAKQVLLLRARAHRPPWQRNSR
jgi:Kinesin motor domain